MTAPAYDLWHQPPVAPAPRKSDALVRALAQHRVAVERLAVELAIEAGEGGITAADIRLRAERRGLVPPDVRGNPRAWSFLARLLSGLVARGELVKTDISRPSPIPGSHRNSQKVYVHRAYTGER